MFQIKTNNPDQTYKLGQKFAAVMKPGMTILLEGDLGAGKTLFVQGFAARLQVKEQVTSPTFNLMNIYQGDCPIYHFDLYRLEQEEELDEIGFYEYSEATDGIVIIEWPDKFPDCLPKEALYIKIELGELPDQREVCVALKGETHKDLYEELETSCLY